MFNEEISQLIEENQIADLVIDVCATLYNNGIEYVHVGGLMRLLGVSDEESAKHDTVYFQLDEHFAQKVAELDSLDEAYEMAVHEEENSTIH